MDPFRGGTEAQKVGEEQRAIRPSRLRLGLVELVGMELAAGNAPGE
jgi:hypothetical protein